MADDSRLSRLEDDMTDVSSTLLKMSVVQQQSVEIQKEQQRMLDEYKATTARHEWNWEVVRWVLTGSGLLAVLVAFLLGS